jgi:hypothetical protein
MVSLLSKVAYSNKNAVVDGRNSGLFLDVDKEKEEV